MTENFEPACRRMEWLDPFYKRVWETAFHEGIPISGTFELTPRCNFNCRMCYVHLKEREIPRYGVELSAEEWIRIAEEAKAAGTTWLCITGGEPLMHPEFPKIWKSLSLMGFFLTLQTNGSLISDDMVKLLEEYPPRQVKITLYGSNDAVYKEVCGIDKGFTRVNDGIHTLMSMGIPVTLVSTILRQNVDDVRNMAYYAQCHQLSWAATIDIKSSWRGKKTDVESVRLKEYLEEKRNEEIRTRIKEGKWVDQERRPCTYCKDYRLGYWILWDGTMKFCSFLNEPQISVRQDSFTSAWNQLLKYEDDLQWSEECRKCEAARVCMKCMASLDMKEGRPQCVRGVSCETVRKYWREYKE